METKRNEPNFMPEISVIVPVHREGEGITAVVERICRTMDGLGRHYEIIVVDDGSDDETAAVAEKAGA